MLVYTNNWLEVQLTLKNEEVRGANSHVVKNPRVTFDSPKTLQLCLGMDTELVTAPLQIPYSVDAPVPYIKWYRSMHIADPPQPWTPKHG